MNVKNDSEYLKKFINKDGLDLTSLIDADFFQPIRILFKKEHYVSSAKLLLVTIDSIAYIEYGDAYKNPFIRWLNTYVKLADLGISADELWEHRNALLHMSNLDSRKNRSGQIRKLIFYVGILPKYIQISDATTGYYSLTNLITALAIGIEKWGNTYNSDRHKIYSFIERYDLIASDARMVKLTT